MDYQREGNDQVFIYSKPKIVICINRIFEWFCGCCGCVTFWGYLEDMPPSRASHLRTLCLCVAIVGYLIFGALMFSFMEGQSELDRMYEMEKTTFEFLRDHECLSDHDLEMYVREVVNANNRGVPVVSNVTRDPNWSFGQALFFTGTVLTTIGYGHVTPLSEGGKFFCIIYALLGIPMTLIMFTALVERMMILTNGLLQILANRLGHIYSPFHIRVIHISILFASLVLVVFILPSVIFCTIEDSWNFLDAFYYCFISMTTIGLGDYIPGDHMEQKHRNIYKLSITAFLFFGLTMMMLVLAHIYEIPEFNVGYYFYMRSDEDEAERKPLCPESGDNKTYDKTRKQIKSDSSTDEVENAETNH